MRLIDADKLLETMETFLTKAENEARYTGRRGVEVTWNDAVYMIKVAPTIEPERKTGQWILADTYAGKRYRCSECLSFALKTDDGQENLSDYCPVCGARMGEGEQE